MSKRGVLLSLHGRKKIDGTFYLTIRRCLLRVIALCLLTTLMTACFGQGDINNMQNEAEGVLGITFPDGAENVQYLYQPESDEYKKPYTIYVKVELSENDYVDLITQLGLTTMDKGGGAFRYLLPGALLPSQDAPNWWKVSALSAENNSTATGSFGNAQNFGWIVAAYEDGYACIKAFEQATP